MNIHFISIYDENHFFNPFNRPTFVPQKFIPMKRMYMKVSTLLLVIITGTTAYSQEMPTFKTDQEKEAWINANPAAYERITTQNATTVVPNTTVIAQPAPSKVDLPGFPQYVNTGNEDLDKQNYEAAKTEWVKNNPAEYQQAQKQENSNFKKVELPGYPVYVNTGNKELDDANYRAAKDQWIENNRELYNSQFTKSTVTKENSINN
jgi:hypothetical protein